MKRFGVVALLIAVVAGGFVLWRGLSNGAPAKNAASQAPQVPVAEVVMRPIAQTAVFTGTVHAVDTVALRPRVSGYLTAIDFEEGARVEQGKRLFQIDARPFQDRVDAAQATLRQSRAQLARAKLELDRARRLVERGVAAQKRLDDAEAAHRALSAKTQAARATLSQARLYLEYASVTAPITGRTSRAFVTEGNLVDAATMLTRIVSTGPVYVDFDIDEATYLRLANRLGPDGRPDRATPVAVKLVTESGFPHEGKLKLLDNQVDADTGTLAARALLPNPSGVLKPGLFARVRLTISQPKSTPLIADAAVRTAQGKRFVLVVDDNKTAFRAITLGPMHDGLRVVRDGLSAGERIVLKGLVGPGMTVRPKPVSMTGDAAPMADKTTSAER